jgi:hypothetical protein
MRLSLCGNKKIKLAQRYQNRLRKRADLPHHLTRPLTQAVPTSSSNYISFFGFDATCVRIAAVGKLESTLSDIKQTIQ